MKVLNINLKEDEFQLCCGNVTFFLNIFIGCRRFHYNHYSRWNLLTQELDTLASDTSRGDYCDAVCSYAVSEPVSGPSKTKFWEIYLDKSRMRSYLVWTIAWQLQWSRAFEALVFFFWFFSVCSCTQQFHNV